MSDTRKCCRIVPQDCGRHIPNVNARLTDEQLRKLAGIALAGILERRNSTCLVEVDRVLKELPLCDETSLQV